MPLLLPSSPSSSSLLLLLLPCLLLLSQAGQVGAGGSAGGPGRSLENCSQGDACKEGVVLPVWNPQNPSVGDKVARAIV